MDPDVQLMLGFVEHYLSIPVPGGNRLYTLAEALAASARRLGIPGDRLVQIASQVRGLVRRGEAIAVAASTGELTAEFQEYLGGFVAPAHTVLVRVRFERADGTIRTALAEVPWTSTVENAVELARSSLVQTSGEQELWANAGWEIVGPTIAPSPQSM